MTVVDNVLMAPGVNGQLYALSPKTGKILSSPQASAGVNAPPAVSGRSVYIGAGMATEPGQQAALTAVADWLEGHESRAKSVREEGVAMGCRDGDLAQFTTDLLKRVGNAAGTTAAGAPKANVSPLEGGAK